MGRDGSQSPEKLLPDRMNRSDRNTESNRNCSFGMIPNPMRGCSFNPNINQPPPPQQQQPQPQTPWFGSLSPIRRTTSPPSTSSATADGIPLYPCLPLPYNCHHDNHNMNHNNNNENTSVGGIMALTNSGFGGHKNQTNTPPPRKLTFNIRSPQIAPVNTVIDTTSTPTCPPQTPPDQQCVAIYRLTRKLQWLIPIVLMVQSIIFIITMYENDCPHTYFNPSKCVLKFLSRLSFQPLNENPLLGPSYGTLLSVGALNSLLVTNSRQGWRLITAVWLHAGVFHLLANIVGLLSIGRRLEKEFGWIKVAIIYLLGGFGGSLLSALFLQKQISVGASGALMGLLGATISEMLMNWSTENGANNYQRGKSLAALLLTLTVNLTFGLMPHVDNFAHIGGLCAGGLLGFILLMRPRSGVWVNPSWIIGHGGASGEVPTTTLQKHSSAQNTARFIALGLLVFSYAMGMLALFKGYALGSRRTCKWCKYMSCVPSFLWQCRSA
ncbi:unnamed protein product [Calypogeia fissa]